MRLGELFLTNEKGVARKIGEPVGIKVLGRSAYGLANLRDA